MRKMAGRMGLQRDVMKEWYVNGCTLSRMDHGVVAQGAGAGDRVVWEGVFFGAQVNGGCVYH